MKRNIGVFLSKLMIAIAVLLIIVSCVRQAYRPVMIDDDEEWLNMVSDYRKAVAKNPEDQEMKSSLRKAELDAAEHFYRQAIEQKDAGKIDEAIASMQKGMAVMPQNDKISRALTMMLAARESDNSYKDAMIMKESGNIEECRKLLEKSLELNPENSLAQDSLNSIKDEGTSDSDGLSSDGKKITIKFSGADLKTVMDYVASQYKFSVLYDEGAKNLPLSVSDDEVTLEQAIKDIMSSAGAFYKKVGDNSILVVQDTKAKRDQYEDLYIRTFQLNSVKASDMANMLKNTLNLKRVTVNDSINAVTVRDSKDILKLASKVVSLNDKKPAEVLFDVEIMEVNRTKAEQLGINYGSQMSLKLSQPDTVGDLLTTKLSQLLSKSTLTLPAFTLNFFKQDVDAKMLANPRVRVIEGKQAKIHIGDRVPLRSSIIQDATGQVRYSYDYKDIGVMLDVTPKINLDNSVYVTLNLEVSSLGSNIGTQNDPAYSIGTRDAQTSMVLRDGETAILGGLIRDEERHNKTSIPGLGDIPIIGSIFTTSLDETGARTDVLLTITPRVVRSWDLIDGNLREIYSGTENSMASEPKYVSMKKKQKDTSIPAQASAPAPVSVTSDVNVSVVDVSPSKSTVAEVASMSFEESQYVVQSGQETEVIVTADNLKTQNAVVTVAFNQEYVKYLSATSGAGAIAVDDSKSSTGTVDLSISPSNQQTVGKTKLASLKFKGERQGVSYLTILNVKTKDKDGNEISVQKGASRIVVK